MEFAIRVHFVSYSNNLKCILQAGFYEIYQPDGRTRVVSYTADDIQGFRANVSYTEPDGYFSSSRYVRNFF